MFRLLAESSACARNKLFVRYGKNVPQIVFNWRCLERHPRDHCDIYSSERLDFLSVWFRLSFHEKAEFTLGIISLIAGTNRADFVCAQGDYGPWTFLWLCLVVFCRKLNSFNRFHSRKNLFSLIKKYKEKSTRTKWNKKSLKRPANWLRSPSMLNNY